MITYMEDHLMNMKKRIAALLALCLLLGGAGRAGGGGRRRGERPAALLPGRRGPRRGGGRGDANAEAAEDVGDYVEGAEEYVSSTRRKRRSWWATWSRWTDLSITEGLSKSWLNILLLGTDSRGTTKYLRTDTMVILSVNEGTGAVKLTSLMRDIWVEIPEYGGQKLNAACVYGGPELTVKMINEYFGLNIRDYALVNMKCLVEIVDSLGGIQLDVSPAEAEAINKLIATTEGRLTTRTPLRRPCPPASRCC